MTDNSVLKKYTNSTTATADATKSAEGEALDDLGSFGWLRGIRDRAIMLEIRHKDGRISAFGYAWLDEATFDPSEGITLRFSGKKVRFVGRNLNGESKPNIRLFVGIVRHRVPWIMEADRPTSLESAKGATIIEEVEIE